MHTKCYSLARGTSVLLTNKVCTIPDLRFPELTAVIYAGIPSAIAKCVSVPSSTNSPCKFTQYTINATHNGHLVSISVYRLLIW